jgi:hypothetical protein
MELTQKMDAIRGQKSQKSLVGKAPSGAVSNRSEEDCHKKGLRVPGAPFYSGDGSILVVGFDTEYVPLVGRNEIVSYQFAADDLRGHRWKHVDPVEAGERFNLDTLLTAAVRMGFCLGHLSRWPKLVYLVGHFTLADLPGFVDFDETKFSFDSIRKTFVTIQRPAMFRLWDENHHGHYVHVVLRDCMLLMPGGKRALKDLGDLVGLAKVELTEDQIAAMDRLLRENRQLFMDYAERDPEICVEFAIQMLELNREINGKATVPPTLSGMGVTRLLRLWEEKAIDRHASLGTELVCERNWSAKSNRLFKRTRIVPLQSRQLYESFATECYHGGRNEAFEFGACSEGIWTDHDLCGAYTTAMVMIGVPDWEGIYQTRDVDSFQPDILGFSRVRFEFPDTTRFPCLPVRTSFGLLFPLSGESCCCAPEIYLASKMGARLQILNGIILPSSFEIRPFESFVIECSRRRKSFVRGSLPELLWKELGNSLYGKIAQGLMMKRCYDSRSGLYRPLPPSKITNPFFAAYITSFVRAVLGEILSRLLNDAEVCSATTDGFLTTASEEDIRSATDGLLCRMFAQARLRVCGKQTILEAKHKIAQPLVWRTRGQATLTPIQGERIVLAKAGIKAPKHLRDEIAQNDWIIELFANRTAESCQEIELFRCLADIHQNGGDLTKNSLVRRVSMDYDWKRRPVNPSTAPIRGVLHVRFDTVPWNNVGEFLRCREKWECFRNRGGAPIKRVEDLNDFGEYMVVHSASRSLKTPRRKAALITAKRMFLRAYTRLAWGLDAGAMSYSELARWLSEQGYPTTKADVENARRPTARLIEHAVPHTSAVERFVDTISSRFPSFERSKLLVTAA